MKTYILDTSALIFNPSCWTKFTNSKVIIPIAVLGELDKLKKQNGVVGKNARVCIRLLDEISASGDISKGIELPNENNITLMVDAGNYELLVSLFGDPTYGDTQILSCLYSNWKNHPDKDVTLVSNDINLRVKAKSHGINAVSHDTKDTSIEELYSGFQIITNEDAGVELATKGEINIVDYKLDSLYHNECVLFRGDDGENIIMGRRVSNKIRTLKKCYPWQLSSRNKEQAFAIDLIMDKNIDLVTLIGRAGTGKTLVALASALELVLNSRFYDKLVIYRPIQSVGKEIGYLPGTLQEKLAPWFQAILDNLELLFSDKSGSDWKKDLEMFQKKGRIEMEAITYIRGRSIPNAIIMVDECQNLTQDEVKTILTRAGEGTKVILTGDLEQIDNNDLDAVNNGLTHVIESFKNSGLAGHITFTQGERSRLATLASDIL